MSSLLNVLVDQLDDQAIQQIGSQLGADNQTTQQAISTALPLLVGALGRNTENPQGAESLLNALQSDHDGSILNNVAGAVTNQAVQQDGSAILSHILGARQDTVAQGVSQASGLDTGSTGQLLSMLAPIVMGQLGQTQQQQGLDASGLAGLLGSERQEADSQLSGLSRLLDFDGDGQIADDVINIGSKLLSSLFGRRS
jgi:hypothetical protein